MRAVSDTGPLLHLFETGLLRCFVIFEVVLVPAEVREELEHFGVWEKFCGVLKLE